MKHKHKSTRNKSKHKQLALHHETLRHSKENNQEWKTQPTEQKKNLQTICLIRDYYPKYTGNSYKSIAKKKGKEKQATDLNRRTLSTEELILSNCGAGEDSCESLGQQGDQNSQA